jgi:hypothetical protein
LKEKLGEGIGWRGFSLLSSFDGSEVYSNAPQSLMAFSELSKDDLGRIAREDLAVLRRSDTPPIPDTKGLTFSEIERAAHAVGQRSSATTTADALANAADEQAEFVACPQCRHSTRVSA